MAFSINLPRIVEHLVSQDRDRATLARCQIEAAVIADDHFDYSRVVVKKPWGYEYLIFQNESVAVWILFIKPGASTSMHCHLHKKTSLSVLSGSVVCALHDDEIPRRAGEGLLIGETVFHQTRATSVKGAFVMEVETPVNKRDLVRFKDPYGREGLGYESTDHMTVNLSNYNYISFINSTIYYNVKKRFGETSLQLVRSEQAQDLSTVLRGTSCDLIGVLKGSVHNGNLTHHPGHMLEFEESASQGNFVVEAGFEGIVISTRDRSVRAADFIISHLKARNVRSFFFAPGRSNAHLVDAIARETEINFIPQTSDASAAWAAVTNAKLTGELSCCIVSTGAAGTMAMTAAADAWTDSTPVLFISAQSCLSTVDSSGLQLVRQLANKQLPISRLVEPITKLSAVVTDVIRMKEYLDQAIHTALERRQGPVWLDLPIDILGMTIDEDAQVSFQPQPETTAGQEPGLIAQVERALILLRSAKRPVILAGYGIRAANAGPALLQLAESCGIPVLTSRRGADLLPDDYPLFFGRPGSYGQRSANFIIQNADVLLSIGCRLSLPLTGRNVRSFARDATKIVVDIDGAELTKPTIDADLPIAADAGHFIRALLEKLITTPISALPDWLERCRRWRRDFPPSREQRLEDGRAVDPYKVIELLSEVLPEETILIAEGGTCVDYLMQSFKFKRGQRLLSSSGLEADGFTLAGAIGTVSASRGKRSVCFCEASSFLQSLSEASSIIQRDLPVTIVVFCSSADLGVRQMQASYFGGRLVEMPPQHTAADQALAMFHFLHQTPTFSLKKSVDIASVMQRLFPASGTTLCSIHLPEKHEMVPRLTMTVKSDGSWTSRPLEDMYPLLSREILQENMLIDLLEET